MRFYHSFCPIFDGNSKILILGSFPSVQSRAQGFYYAHPLNRFWRIVAVLTGTDPVPTTIEGKRQILLDGGIALWDIVASCDVDGSGDDGIENAVPNDLSRIFDHCRLKRVFANGKKAYDLARKYQSCGEIIRMSSTSSANATYSFERLVREWKRVVGVHVVKRNLNGSVRTGY